MRWYVLISALGLSTLCLAAEAIKIDLEKVKMKPEGEGGEELVKFHEDKLCFFTNGTGTITVNIPEDGLYSVTINASCDEAEKMKAKLTLVLGKDKVAENFELKSTEAKDYMFNARLKKGETTLSISFVNDMYKENEYDLNMYVHAISLSKK